MTFAAAQEEGRAPRVVKGIVNARVRGSYQEYKVRFAGCTKADDAWVPADFEGIEPAQVGSLSSVPLRVQRRRQSAAVLVPSFLLALTNPLARA
jgi:hypothetical protein